MAGPDEPQRFGLATATFVVVASMIGVGILTTSGLAVYHLGSTQIVLWLWVIGGLAALCGALSLAELSAALPRNGGEYVIYLETYGRLPAFLAGWVTFQAGFSCPIAAASSAAASYLLAPIAIPDHLAPHARLALAIGALIFFGIVHASGTNRAARLQGVVTVAELVGLGLFAITGLALGWRNASNLNDLPTFSGDLATEMFANLVYVAYGYTGWNAAAYLAGDVKDAPRVVPRAILIGTLLVTGLYIALNLVYAFAIDAAEVKRLGRESLARYGDLQGIEPIAQISAGRLFGQGWSTPFSIAVGLILLATCSAFVLTGPRVMFAMARAGQFPAFVGRMSPRTGTPVIATALQVGWAVVLLVTGSFDAIVRYAGLALSFVSMFTVAAVFVLRIKQPDLPRPFRVPLYPIVPAIYLLIAGALTLAVAIKEPWLAGASLVSILSGVPLYPLLSRRRAEP